jgi:hypothetical protein
MSLGKVLGYLSPKRDIGEISQLVHEGDCSRDPLYMYKAIGRSIVRGPIVGGIVGLGYSIISNEAPNQHIISGASFGVFLDLHMNGIARLGSYIYRGIPDTIDINGNGNA